MAKVRRDESKCTSWHFVGVLGTPTTQKSGGGCGRGKRNPQYVAALQEVDFGSREETEALPLFAGLASLAACGECVCDV
jgi:hypothetical protein